MTVLQDTKDPLRTKSNKTRIETMSQELGYDDEIKP